MTPLRVRLWLILSMTSLVAIPLISAFVLFRDVLETSLSLSAQQETIEALETGQLALKELAQQNPSQAEAQRQKFLQVQNLKLNLADQELLKTGLLNSFSLYFLIGLLVMVATALLLALILNRKVAQAYDANLTALLKQQEKNRFLEEINHWQDVAKQLAHEIKNPLQPIRTWMSNLSFVYQSQGNSIQFEETLSEAVQCVDQEIQNLQGMVDSFTRFARLPQIRFQEVEIDGLIRNFFRDYQGTYNIDFLFHCQTPELRIQADPHLLRQALANLTTNAVEANPGRKVPISVSLIAGASNLTLVYENLGTPLNLNIRERIFEPSVTTKSSESNFGLGLAITRKIILEHGGDIRAEDSADGARFIIEMPLNQEAK